MENKICIRCGIKPATKVVTYELYNLPRAAWFAVDACVCDDCSERLRVKEEVGLIRNYKTLQEL